MIIAFHLEHRGDRYRRVTFMKLDLNIVAVSSFTTRRVIESGIVERTEQQSAKKGGTSKS